MNIYDFARELNVNLFLDAAIFWYLVITLYRLIDRLIMKGAGTGAGVLVQKNAKTWEDIWNSHPTYTYIYASSQWTSLSSI